MCVCVCVKFRNWVGGSSPVLLHIGRILVKSWVHLMHTQAEGVVTTHEIWTTGSTFRGLSRPITPSIPRSTSHTGDSTTKISEYTHTRTLRPVLFTSTAASFSVNWLIGWSRPTAVHARRCPRYCSDGTVLCVRRVDWSLEGEIVEIGVWW